MSSPADHTGTAEEVVAEALWLHWDNQGGGGSHAHHHAAGCVVAALRSAGWLRDVPEGAK
jgi:hypothetical protein